jgi:hypothetical protein
MPSRSEYKQVALTDAVQAHLDAAAQARGYDNIVSACSYAAAANAFQAEAVAYLNWRASVWQHCHLVLAAVQSGTRIAPTAAELITELPALVLP